jgi:SAM-dependent methyltransferase
MSEPEPVTVVDPTFGFRRLDPLPAADDLDRFYQSAYADMVRRGERFPELRRILEGGEEADRERHWIRRTLHADLLASLDRHADHDGERTLLDIGSGMGELLASASASGWTAIGLEPSHEAAEIGRAEGRTIENATFEEYIAGPDKPKAPTAITLTNVLEHVRDPVGLLRSIRGFLGPGGLVAVRVPNDFNPLQSEVRRTFGHRAWWIAAPDHINYFDHATLAATVRGTGFEVRDQWADFPMEMLALMGDDYVADPAVGRVAHERRRRFELAVDPEIRRGLARALVPLGWGRNSIVVGRVDGSSPASGPG